MADRIVYYVRPDGNDANDGLSPLATRAFKTINKAQSVAVGVDLIRMSPGYHYSNGVLAGSGMTIDTYINGDPKAEFFTDMQPGEVVVGSAPTKNGIRANNYTIYNLSGGVYQYLTILQGRDSAILYSNCKFKHCIIYGTVRGIELKSGIHYAFFYCTFHNCFMIGRGDSFWRCVFTSLQYDSNLTTYSTNTTLVFYQCYITLNLLLMPNPSSSAVINEVKFLGCDITLAALGFGHSIVLAETTVLQKLEFDGCILHGGTLILDYDSTHKNLELIIRGCDIHGMIDFLKIYDGYDIENIEYNYFKNITNIFVSTLTSPKTISNNVVENCNSISNDANIIIADWKISNAGHTLLSTGNSFTLAPIIESDKKGIFPTSLNPIGSETTSIMFKGYNYAPVKLFWGRCRAGVPTVVNLLSKRNESTDVYSESASMIKFGLYMGYFVYEDTNEHFYQISYTHYKTELVPIFIFPQPLSSTDYTIISSVNVAEG